MKRVILVMIVLACWTGLTNAQIRFGIKGGLNYDNFHFSSAKNDLQLDNSTGWHAGALLQFKVPIIGIGLQPELLYTVKKSDVNEKSNSVGYFEVPVNLRWGFNLLVVKPYLLAGPYFSYATNLKGDTFKDKIERFDWGVGLGGGVEIWKLQLGFRYAWGLQNVSSVSEFKMKNRTFSASLG